MDNNNKDIREEDAQRAFAGLVERYSGVISKVCYMYAESAGEAADMRQDILLNLWKSRDSFRGEANMSTWIHRVCINTCISYIRKEKKHRAAGGPELMDLIPETVPDRREMLRQMHDLIRRLKTRERALILLWLEDFNYDEIAEVVGVGRNTVATSLRRIKQKLMEMAKD